MDCLKKIIIMLCLSLMASLQSCVWNDLADCPPAVRYALTFEYTLHPDNPLDRFAEDVDRMFVYVFDSTGYCVIADTTLTGPFPPGYTYPLDLNSGRYDIITWGWGRNTGDPTLERSTIVIPTVVPGVTRITDAKLILEEIENNNIDIVDGKIEKTFYGEQHINLPAFISRVDTVPLKNLANLIRIIIPDATKLEGWKDITVSIEGYNGAYIFNNSYDYPSAEIGTGHVIYRSYSRYYTDSVAYYEPINIAYPYGSATGRDSMLIVDVSSLRLIYGDHDLKVVVYYQGRRIEFPLVDLLSDAIRELMATPGGMPAPPANDFYKYYVNTPLDWQIKYYLDSVNRWQLVIEITATHVTCSVTPIKWHVIKQNVGAGGIMQ